MCYSEATWDSEISKTFRVGKNDFETSHLLKIIPYICLFKQMLKRDKEFLFVRISLKKGRDHKNYHPTLESFKSGKKFY
jgi:hypothetical protein